MDQYTRNYLYVLLGFVPLLVLIPSFLHAAYLLFFPGVKHRAVIVTRVAVGVSASLWALVLVYWVLFGRAATIHDYFKISVGLATVAMTAFFVLIPIYGLTVSLVKNWPNKVLKIGLCIFHGLATLIAVVGIVGVLFMSLLANMELCSRVTTGTWGRCGSLQY